MEAEHCIFVQVKRLLSTAVYSFRTNRGQQAGGAPAAVPAAVPSTGGRYRPAAAAAGSGAEPAAQEPAAAEEPGAAEEGRTLPRTLSGGGAVSKQGAGPRNTDYPPTTWP